MKKMLKGKKLKEPGDIVASLHTPDPVIVEVKVFVAEVVGEVIYAKVFVKFTPIQTNCFLNT